MTGGFAVNTPFAWEILPEKKLYKFRGFVTSEQKERLRDVVMGHRIRFSRLSELNDPSEGKPTFCLGDWNSLAYRRRLERWVLNLNTLRNVSDPRVKKNLKRWVKSLTKYDHERFIHEIVEGNQARLEHRWRVLSLSASGSHELLWAHYADSHRGVALVFDASDGEFGAALQVRYVDQLASIDIMDEEPSSNFQASLLTKRTAWAYEAEYRCIAADSNDPFLPIHNQFLSFPPERLLGVIFGAKSSRADKELIVGWSKERSVALSFWQASVSVNGNTAVTPYAL